MTGTNHVLTGLAIAASVRHPVLAPVLAFFSHFILDAVPHYDYGGVPQGSPWSNKLVRLLFFDGILCFSALGLAIYLAPEMWWLFALCSFAATLPDWLWILHYKFDHNHWFYDFHHWIQWAEKPWGYVIEIPYALLTVALLVLLAHS
jgi:hypothetical protein